MRVRKAARILLLNERNRVFLFQFEDSYAKRIFWFSPGGGLEEGERFEAAAHRELWEETGIRNATLGPWVWTREKPVSFKGELLLSYERFFLVRVQSQEVVLDHMMEQCLRFWSDFDPVCHTKLIHRRKRKHPSSSSRGVVQHLA